MIITTTPQIEGYEITEFIGLVGDSIFLSNIKGIENLLKNLAFAKGANAVVGVMVHPIASVSGDRYSTNTEMDLAYVYGTAVKIRKIEKRPVMVASAPSSQPMPTLPSSSSKPAPTYTPPKDYIPRWSADYRMLPSADEQWNEQRNKNTEPWDAENGSNE